MKHLILAVAIALLSTPAATTAWSQQPTEQETKDFIVETMGKCEYVTEVKFEGSNLHLSDNDREFNSFYNEFGDLYYSYIVPVQKLKVAEAYNDYGIVSLSLTCRGAEGACSLRSNDEGPIKKGSLSKTDLAIIKACSHQTNEVLAKAFNHLIGIYDAERPKPLFE